MTPILRGQVWSLTNSETVLVISSDKFNAMNMKEVLALPLMDLDRSSYSAGRHVAFGIPNKFGGQLQLMIDCHSILNLARAQFKSLEFEHLKLVMPKVETLLKSFFEPQARLTPPPRNFPAAGQMKMADLSIPGNSDKPVIILSNANFGQTVGWNELVLCRKTSGQAKRAFEVPLQITGGSAVVHDLRTWPLDRIKVRAAFNSSVAPAEKVKIFKALYELLGLS